MGYKNILKLAFTITLLLPVIPNARAQSQPTDTTISILRDDPIAAMLDSLFNLRIFNYLQNVQAMKMPDEHGFHPDSIPAFDDFVYEARLAKLDAISPFKLDYNESVQAYINMYAYRKKEQVGKMLALSGLYFPLFEEILDKHGLPLELKYLAIVESALNANAKSRAGAMGLWQFMYGTGKMYGLRVNSYVDERCDPVLATEAACKYLKFLHGMYNDWQLALAAYNAGPGTVNKAIRRSGGKTNYWELRPYLPLETRGYVPAFIAVNYVMNHTKEHNIQPAGSLTHLLEIDSVKLKQPLNLSQIADALAIPVEDIQFFNPVYKHNVIPCLEGEFNTLYLPREHITQFILKEDEIYTTSKTITETVSTVQVAEYNTARKHHVVRRGESLSVIAQKYRCSVTDIKRWNNLRNNNLFAGQKLLIHTKPGPKDTETAKTQQPNQPTAIVSTPKPSVPNTKVVYYTVQPGDTLWKIANKYNGVSVEDLKRLNNIKNASNIKVGSKIKVMVQG